MVQKGSVTPWTISSLLALACGYSLENAAREAGVSESTAYRRMADAEFTRQLQAMRADMVQRTAGALTAAATEAVRTLLDLLKPPALPRRALGAAWSVLVSRRKLREKAADPGSPAWHAGRTNWPTTTPARADGGDG